MADYGVLLDGHRQIQRRLERLASVAQRRVVRPAVNKALTPIVKDAKRRCPILMPGEMAGGRPLIAGLLKRSIGKGVKVFKRSGNVWGAVGPRRGFKKQLADGSMQDPVRYAHLVEKGTEETAAKPYLDPALDSQKATALGILAEGIRMGLEKEARRGR